MLRKSIACLAVALLAAAPLYARPLITDPVATNGRFVFEGAFGLSYRDDKFKDPKADYSSVLFPIEFNLGLSDKLDVGFSLTHAAQRLDVPDARYKGSANGLFAPHFKFSPWPYAGFLFRWHVKHSEDNDNLPIGQGNEYETKLLLKAPRLPLTLNVGYLFRESYDSRKGMRETQPVNIAPGNIFETSGAFEVPVRWGLAGLGELDYNHVDGQRVDRVRTPGTRGSALDALVGITWARGPWNLGAGVAFGLLDEQFTSFEYDRGAGDYQFRFRASYHLRPRRPGAES